MSIVTPGNPTFLAVQSKYNTLKAQGMPDAQIGQILQQEVLPSGGVQLSQLWQMVQYLKKNGAATQAPPTDTVAQQIAKQTLALSQQRTEPLGPVPQMGQQAQPPFPPSGLSGAPPSAGPSAPPPPPGVAGLPQGNVGQPGAYAGGGIISLAGGGDFVGDPTPDWSAPDYFGVDPQSHLSRADLQKMYESGQLSATGRDNYVGDPSQDPNGMSVIDPHHRMTRTDWQQMYANGRAPAAAAAAPTGEVSATDGAGHPYSLGNQPQPGAFANPYSFDFLKSQGMNAASPPGKALPLTEPDEMYGGGSRLGGKGGARMPDLIAEGKDPTLDQLTSDSLAAYKKMGLGSMAAEANRYAGAEEAKNVKDNKYDRNLALANAGFAMAQAASKGGATFLGSAGAGGTALAQGLQGVKERQDQAAERVENLKLKALGEEDQGKQVVFKDVMDTLRTASNEKRADVRANAQIKVEWMKAQTQEYIAANHDAVMRYVNKGDPGLKGLEEAYRLNPTPENQKAISDYIMATNPEVIAAAIMAKSRAQLQATNPAMYPYRMLQAQQQQGGMMSPDFQGYPAPVLDDESEQ